MEHADFRGALRVLDVASGLGAAAIAAARLGHSVTAVDGGRCMRDIARRNFVANGVDVELVDADICSAAALGGREFDLFLVSQVAYDKSFARCVQRFIERLAAPGAEVVWAEPEVFRRGWELDAMVWRAAGPASWSLEQRLNDTAVGGNPFVQHTTIDIWRMAN